MSTLLFRLSAPIQAWGTEPAFDKWIRTGMEPSKSGVIGLIASALGIDRKEDDKIQFLTDNLRFGVRVDQEGLIGTDYQAVRIVNHEGCNYRDLYSNYVVINGKKLADSNISKYDFKKYYLMDAKFTIGLESEDEDLLIMIRNALRHPKRFLYLGRKNCPLAEALDGNIVSLPLYEALTEEVLKQKVAHYRSYRIVYDAAKGERASIVRDNPVSFNSKKRTYGVRGIVEKMVEVFPESQKHDPFDYL